MNMILIMLGTKFMFTDLLFSILCAFVIISCFLARSPKEFFLKLIYGTIAIGITICITPHSDLVRIVSCVKNLLK